MEREWRPPAGVELETDPRFPSGKWTGFWLQPTLAGRQWMSLTLSFFDGKVQGEGTDSVGEFAMSGSYELSNGTCSIVKSYVGAHEVVYEGRNEDDGMWIWGLWHIATTDRGGFHLWPAGEEDPTGARLKAAKELGVKKRRVKLEPIGG